MLNLFCEEETESWEGSDHQENYYSPNFKETPKRKKQVNINFMNESQLTKSVLFRISEGMQIDNISNEDLAENCNLGLSRIHEDLKKTLSGMATDISFKSKENAMSCKKYENTISEKNNLILQLKYDLMNSKLRHDKDLANTQQMLFEQSNENKKLQSIISQRDLEIEALQRKKFSLASQVDDLNTNNQNLTIMRDTFERNFMELHNSIENLNKKSLEDQSNKFKLESELLLLKSKFESMAKTNNELDQRINDLMNKNLEGEMKIKSLEMENSILNGKLSNFDSDKIKEELTSLKKYFQNKKCNDESKISVSTPSKDFSEKLVIQESSIFKELNEFKFILEKSKDDNSRIKSKLVNYERINFVIYRTLSWHQEELKSKENLITLLRIKLYAISNEIVQKEIAIEEFKKKMIFYMEKQFEDNSTKLIEIIKEKFNSFSSKISFIDSKVRMVKKNLKSKELSTNFATNDAIVEMERMKKYFLIALQSESWCLNSLCLFIKRFIENSMEDLENSLSKDYMKIVSNLQTLNLKLHSTDSIKAESLISMQKQYSHTQSCISIKIRENYWNF